MRPPSQAPHARADRRAFSDGATLTAFQLAGPDEAVQHATWRVCQNNLHRCSGGLLSVETAKGTEEKGGKDKLSELASHIP